MPASTSRGGVLALGLLFVALGVAALMWRSATGYGLLLAIAGTAEVVHALRLRKTDRFTVHLLGGSLSLVTGALMIDRPDIGLAALTVRLASYLLVGGLLRGMSALLDRFQLWAFDCGGGLFSLVLGVIVLARAPAPALGVLGLFITAELLSRGLTLAAMAAPLPRGALQRSSMSRRL